MFGKFSLVGITFRLSLLVNPRFFPMPMQVHKREIDCD